MAACSGGDTGPIKVSGELVFNADEIGDGATARVSMFERGPEGAEKRIVAERTLHNLKSKPIRFDFEVARNLINPEGSYALRAQILDAQGDVEWTTRETARIQPLQQSAPVSLALTRLVDESSLVFERYQCPDGFFAQVGAGEGRVLLRMGNRRLTLDSESAGQSSSAYADDHGNRIELREDKTADMIVDGATHRDCAMVRASAPDGGSNDPASSDAPKS
ncbi:hypothetical protein T31B1_08308 [Salinisphaera sp. T31B1]